MQSWSLCTERLCCYWVEVKCTLHHPALNLQIMECLLCPLWYFLWILVVSYFLKEINQIAAVSHQTPAVVSRTECTVRSWCISESGESQNPRALSSVLFGKQGAVRPEQAVTLVKCRTEQEAVYGQTDCVNVTWEFTSVIAVYMQQHTLDEIHRGRKHSHIDVSNRAISISHYVANLFKVHTYSSSLNVTSPWKHFSHMWLTTLWTTHGENT